MMRKFLSILALAMIAIAAMTGCSQENNPVTPDPEPTPTPEPVSEQADYTFIMLACGGGDLDWSIIGELIENYTDFQDPKVQLAGIFKPSKQIQTELGANAGTRYFKLALKQGVNPETVKTLFSSLSKLEDGKEKHLKYTQAFYDYLVNDAYADSLYALNEPANIAAMIKLVAEKNPAKKYILVTDNHGGGWNTADDKPTRAMVTDDNCKKAGISLDQLNAGVAASGIEFQAIFCDLCLMATHENLAGYQENFKVAIASSELTTGSNIGKLALRLKSIGANADDGTFYNQCAEWVLKDEYKDDWDTYANMQPGKGTDCQDMGVYNLQKWDQVTTSVKNLTNWYISNYSNQAAQRAINWAVLNANYAAAASREESKTDDKYASLATWQNQKKIWKTLGLNGQDICQMLVDGEKEKLRQTLAAYKAEMTDFREKNSDDYYGYTLAHLVRQTIMYGKQFNALGISELEKLYNDYISTLKSVSAIRCSHYDYNDADPYVWTSPNVTVGALNKDNYYEDDESFLNCSLASFSTLDEALASYTHTQFDQKTGWSNFLKLLTVNPSQLTNPFRPTAMFNSIQEP